MNDIITSEAKADPEDGSSDTPWMVDGAGLPPNASELLPKLVIFFAELKSMPKASCCFCSHIAALCDYKIRVSCSFHLPITQLFHDAFVCLQTWLPSNGYIQNILRDC